MAEPNTHQALAAFAAFILALWASAQQSTLASALPSARQAALG